MQVNVSAMERAFHLARSGEHSTFSAVKKQVEREGYDGRQLAGGVLKRQLTRLAQDSSTRDHGNGQS